MTSTAYASAVAILAIGLMAATCEDKNLRFVLEKMPQEYRACAAEVVPEINGTSRVTQKDLIEYTARLKKYAGKQNRCLRGAVAWADAQWNVYYQQF